MAAPAAARRASRGVADSAPVAGRKRLGVKDGRRPPRSGASALFVSAGDSFAPRRERFLCLRRPHFFQQRKKWGKERRQKLRFCTSSARYAQQRFPAYSRGQSPLLSLSVKRTACTFTGAEADAAACFSHGRNFPLLPPSPPSLPLEGPAGRQVPPYPGGVSRHLPIAVLRAAMGAI